MKEYIEREAVIKYLTKCADGYSYIETPTESAITHIKAIPAADVVEVVRCRDCVYRRENTTRNKKTLPYYCEIHAEEFCDLDEFCCYGKRRQDGGADDE